MESGVSNIKEYTQLQDVYKDHKGKKFISFSQFSLWMKCPLKWKLMYVDKVLKTEPTMQLIFGKALHEVIQTFFHKALTVSATEARELNLMPLFIAKLTTHVKKAQEKHPQFQATDLGSYYAEAGTIIKYLKGTKFAPLISRKHYELVGIETVVHVPLDKDNDSHLVGAIDVLLKEKATGKYLILDIKITTKGWNSFKKQDDSVISQLVLYKYYFAEQKNIPPEDIMIKYLIFRRVVNVDYLDFPLKRLQEFIPPSGKPTFSKINNKFKEFADIVRDPSKHTFHAIAGKNSGNCRFCEFDKREDLCPKSKRIIHT